MARSDVMCIPIRMHRSPAFRKLTMTAVTVYLEFRYRCKLAEISVKAGRKKEWVILNNGELIFTYAEANKKFKIPRSSFCRSISQLVNLGFIDIAHHGGGMLKDCSKYGISERWKEYGKEGFIEKSRQKDTRGLGFKPETWEDQTRRKRKSKSKIGITADTSSSITGDTISHQIPLAPSIINVTHQLDLKPHYIKDLEQLKAKRLSPHQKRYYSIGFH